MSTFIAFCENSKCGAVFEAPNIVGGSGNATIKMTNARFGPCPVCNSYGVIPDGVYQYANHAISLLTGPESTIKVLQQVHDILKKAKSETSSKKEVLKLVERVSPKTAETLKNAPNVNNYLQWITVLIALVTLAMQAHTSYFKSEDVEKQFREHLLQENKELREQNNNITPHKRTSPKIQRNDKCPCGSGKKYKKCCLIV